MLAYTDKNSYLDAGQGAFEIRTFMTISAATSGLPGTIHFYKPIPIFAVGCTIATIDLPTVDI
jgi:2,3-dihydroxyphenylpropionate 1,2-dioxygenase